MVTVFSLGNIGMEAYTVNVEADVSRGLPAFEIVGLPDAAVKESKERVRSAMRNSGFEFPAGRVVVNLAPADIKKEGPIYDLPILMAILACTGQVDFDPRRACFIGELSLDGELRPVRGVLGMVISARQAGFERVFIPAANRSEGGAVEGITVLPARSVNEIFAHLTGGREIEPAVFVGSDEAAQAVPDLCEVRGQEEAKRGLEIAAAGSHNLLLVGPPGSGKSMLAKRLPGILPPMNTEESIETTKVYSLAGQMSGGSLITHRPFRSPHHTVSAAGMAGGSAVTGVTPGEISLAHNGVLFMDEFPEFPRKVLEALRQPLEDGTITISRAIGSFTYPCRIMLVAAMNPCPCGFYGSPTKKCTCSEQTVNKYLARVSGPMLDRIDLHITVPAVDYDKLSGAEGEKSAEVAARVAAARAIQNERFGGRQMCNAAMTSDLMRLHCSLDDDGSRVLRAAFERMGLSARGHDRLLKVARTIADLDRSDDIKKRHISEAVQYRSLDRR